MIDSKKKAKLIKRYVLMDLGVLLVAFVLYSLFSKSNRDDHEMMIAYKSELYTPIDANVRGNISDQQLLINGLAKAYEKKDFASVIAAYERLKGSNSSFDMNIEQMAGVAFGSLGNHDRAISIFKNILDTKESSYSNHSTVRYLLSWCICLIMMRIKLEVFWNK